jgi:hypothetical protein
MKIEFTTPLNPLGLIPTPLPNEFPFQPEKLWQSVKSVSIPMDKYQKWKNSFWSCSVSVASESDSETAGSFSKVFDVFDGKENKYPIYNGDDSVSGPFKSNDFYASKPTRYGVIPEEDFLKSRYNCDVFGSLRTHSSYFNYIRHNKNNNTTARMGARFTFGLGAQAYMDYETKKIYPLLSFSGDTVIVTYKGSQDDVDYGDTASFSLSVDGINMPAGGVSVTLPANQSISAHVAWIPVRRIDP